VSVAKAALTKRRANVHSGAPGKIAAASNGLRALAQWLREVVR
jgi:hypothetical protein